MCVIAVVGVAPCQCRSPGGNHTTSPGRISSIAPPSRCAQPRPKVTIRVWPSGCVCQAVRAPGSKVTLAQETRAGSGAVFSGSIRTPPVKYSLSPFCAGCDPARFSSMVVPSPLTWTSDDLPATDLFGHHDCIEIHDPSDGGGVS